MSAARLNLGYLRAREKAFEGKWREQMALLASSLAKEGLVDKVQLERCKRDPTKVLRLRQLAVDVRDLSRIRARFLSDPSKRITGLRATLEARVRPVGLMKAPWHERLALRMKERKAVRDFVRLHFPNKL